MVTQGLNYCTHRLHVHGVYSKDGGRHCGSQVRGTHSETEAREQTCDDHVKQEVDHVEPRGVSSRQVEV